MLVVYLAFGLVVDRYSTRPGSQLRAFARIVCSPITRPMARFAAPGASERRVLALSLAAAAVLWGAFVALDRALRAG